MLRSGGVQGSTLPLPICGWVMLQHPPRDPKRDVAVKQKSIIIKKVGVLIQCDMIILDGTTYWECDGILKNI